MPRRLFAAPRSPRARRLSLLACLTAVFLAVAPEAWARGGQEDPLAAADRLIASQSYNEAIVYLTEFIRQYPDRFDEAQARLKRVIEIREAYNKKAKTLLDVLVNEPTNEEKKLALIRELEALEKKPNKDTRDFITRTKDASLFVYNRSKFEEIMARGRRLIDGKRYAEAAGTYEEGFVLYRDEFDSGPSDELTKAAVATLVSRVKREILSFGSAQTELNLAFNELLSAFTNGDPEAAARAWPRAEAAFLNHARRRNETVAAGRSMERQFEALRRLDATTTDSSFLPFAFRFTLGRSSSVLPEGIVGAMDSQWIELLNAGQVALDRSLDAAYARAEAAYGRGRWSEAITGFDRVAALSDPGLSFLGLWGLVAPTELLQRQTAYGKSVLAGKAAAYERLSHLARLAQAHSRLARIASNLEASSQDLAVYVEELPPTPSLEPTLASFAERRRRLLSLGEALEEERPSARALAEELGRISAAGFGLASSTSAQGVYDGRLAAAIDRYQAGFIELVAQTGKVEYADLAADLAKRRAAVADGRRYLEGIPAPEAPGILFRYPSRSAEVLGAEDAAIRRLRTRIDDFLGRLGREIPYVAGAPAVQAWAEQARELDRGALALQSERQALQARAEEQRRAAEAARQEGDRRLTEARRALQAEDFEQARDRLDKARDRYLASFSLEENARLRDQADLELRGLGQDIVRLENEKVIRDTRRLITEAKTAYFQGAFDRAEDSLLRARARWKTTNGDVPEPELEYWLRLVQAALSVKTGRQIPPTAPLYPEMSQLLSLAKKHYEEGKTLLAQRRKTDALQAFALAKQKLNEVKVVFPLNEEAGVLALRIDQLIDPDAFRLVFGAKFSASRSKLDVNPREAYSELQDLAAIDPRYPGLKAALERAEILLGIRQAPPDPAKIRRARELVASARRIVDAGDRARYPSALEQLNEAIQLDPSNETAGSLKDRILTSQGGSAQIVISTEAEAQYQQAVGLFQNGDTLGAYAIVQRLLQDPNNKRVQKIVDLYNKLQARL